jgi:hypothetical protein
MQQSVLPTHHLYTEHRNYNKTSEGWTAVEVKEKKVYACINDIMRKILLLRLQDREGMSDFVS